MAATDSLYGYFHNGCTYESAAALVSLHATKAGAWRAMRAGIWEQAVKRRETSLLYGHRCHGADLKGQAFFIQPLEIQP